MIHHSCDICILPRHHFKVDLLLPALHWVSVFALLSWQSLSEPADAVTSPATVGSNAASMGKKINVHTFTHLYVLGNYNNY